MHNSESFLATTKSLSGPQYTVSLADSPQDLEQCFRLRYQVFAQELGATIHAAVPDMDTDGFDQYCQHLAVKHMGQVIATTRLLTGAAAARAGMFYSESEFQMSSLLSLPGNFLEIGRTCIHKEHRTGAALNALWQGVAQVMVSENIDYLIGCASIPASDGGRYALSVMNHLRLHHLSPESLRVHPHRRLSAGHLPGSVEVVLPRLLKTYLFCGALVCGEPYWDTDFRVADVLVFVDRHKINARFAKHFLGIHPGTSAAV